MANILSDVDVIDAELNEHDNTATLRIAFLPDFLGDDEYGFFLTQANLQAHHQSFDYVTLYSSGVFTNTQWLSLRLMTALYHVKTSIETAGVDEKFKFTAAYFQLEKNLNQDMTLYTRFEDTRDESGNEYLHTLSAYVPQREVLGVRYDLSRNHALKFEWNQNHHDTETESVYHLNWTAVFP